MIQAPMLARVGGGPKATESGRAVEDRLHQRDAEAALWRAIVEQAQPSADEYRHYLNKFGDGGMFAELAALRIARLEREAQAAKKPSLKKVMAGAAAAVALVSALFALVPQGRQALQHLGLLDDDSNGKLAAVTETDAAEREARRQAEEAARQKAADEARRKAEEEAALRRKAETEAAAVLAPGDTFRDCDICPQMVVVPAGSFLIGSPPDEPDRRDNEGPQRRVTFARPFAIGTYEVTFDEYVKFVEATGHRHEGGLRVWTGSEWKHDPSKSWRDPGFAQTDRDPVTGVNWRDAQAYVDWLAKRTGRPYRLPSEAEWEYAARAGTTTPFHVGRTISPEQTNFGGNRGKTTPVGSFPAHAFGLHDVHGNFWEWVEDVWHDDVRGAPVDGSASTEGEGKDSSRYRVFRGGSWNVDPGILRSAYRGGGRPEIRSYVLGFRVARPLD